ncbi:MAG: pyruvate, phosphate dikinase [Firmicutes bacterium HGW-Firmicutes-11]|jgi:predicted nucleotidyltransferase|nr:MAG: pyruvate, phosphate dikinase [Firmicutes bacterium HGW-Firmicutes-11]
MKYDHSQLLERAKELECMYMVDELLHNKDLTLAAAMKSLTDTIPIGFTIPSACRIKITLWNDVYAADDFSRAEILYRSPIVVMQESVGEIIMGYITELLDVECDILSNEKKMLDTISRLISLLAFDTRRELSQMLEMLRTVDPNMLPRVIEKLRVYLKKTFGAEVDSLFSVIEVAPQQTYGEVNSPMNRPAAVDMDTQLQKIIARATDFLPRGQVHELIGGWIHEERVLAMIKVVDNKDARVSEILDAVRKYTEVTGDNSEKSTTDKWLVAVLAHRFLTNDEKIINLILDNLKISDFIAVLERNIGSHNSRGSIGGKGAGLFIAQQILQHAAVEDPLLREIKTPRTWYLATDQIVDFFNYNNLEELNSYKYNPLYHLRLTYDNLVSKIMNAKLPPRTIQMLHLVLEDMEDVPLVIRSSALLEDGLGIAFSGKYKSLFLSNQGTRQQRLEALITAILEVYSSMFNPDAIQYRREKGLLNFSEEMGVLIQEVVGFKVGKYYMPAFAGVAFSHNQLRWSARINRDDGLVRMVMGLGTRAVDRVTDDYPMLFSLAHPELSVNRTPAEIRHYSPKYIDLINMEDKSFETVTASTFLREEGTRLPELHKYVSVFNENFIENKNAFSLDTKNDDMIITFNHILTATDIPKKLEHIIKALSEKMDAPVEIEFAYDGEDIYLLQCRFQGSNMYAAPAPIPQNLKRQDIVFTANQFISNGLVTGITHVVYVDGKRYDSLSTLEELYAVGEAVGQLGGVLPRHNYILIGPGRWGSRGDIKLGVRVTYSDISNTAALIEIAEKKHSYSPEPSFGTHFFQDLVEAGIVYLPLYPGEKDVIFKESFFRASDNLLGTLLPRFAYLSDVIKVIDVPASYFGRTLSLHMNSDLEQAVAFLTDQEPTSKADLDKKNALSPLWVAKDEQDHWQWRHFMAEQIADSMDMETLGVKGIYLFGSTNSGEAGMGSDIDLLLHIKQQSNSQQQSLKDYLDGWSRALARVNYLQTGYKIDKLLDVHIVTDEDIAERDSFAIKIDSTVDPATPLRLLSE